MLAAGPAKVLRPGRPCSAGRAAIVERLSDVERGSENHSAGGRRGSDRLGRIKNASTETVRLE